jgi:hypothetical protein
MSSKLFRQQKRDIDHYDWTLEIVISFAELRNVFCSNQLKKTNARIGQASRNVSQLQPWYPWRESSIAKQNIP